jgi:hypothetical protein
MRVESKADIAGIPVIKVRDYIRDVQAHRFGADNLAYGLKISVSKARAVVKELLARGYIKKAERLKFERGHAYNCTKNGAQFAAAMATKPVSRSTADRHVANLVERIRAVNANPEYLVWVPRLIVFGSYLTDRDSINDVDVAVVLNRKEQDGEKWIEALMRRVSQAKEAGRVFNTYNQELGWDETEVMLFLKRRSRVLQFARPSVVEQLGCETRVYEFERTDE